MRTLTTILLISLFCTTWAAVPGGRVLYLDGKDDYLKLFEPVINNLPFTIEAWAKMNGPGGGVYKQNVIFVQRENPSLPSSIAIGLWAKNQVDESTVIIRDKKHGKSRMAVPRPAFNEWHHYALAVDTDSFYFYIDGQLVSKDYHQQIGPFKSDLTCTYMGRHYYDEIEAGFFSGFIDELKIWNVARKAEAIRQGLYQPVDLKNVDVKSKLLGYWTFNNKNGFIINDAVYTGVKDHSSFQHHAVFKGNPEIVNIDPQVLALHEFSLNSPFYDATLFTTIPRLTWETATDEIVNLPYEIIYTVLIDSNPQFSSPDTLTVGGNRLAAQPSSLVAGKTYFWQVCAENINGDRIDSDVSAFFIHQSAANVESHSQFPGQFELFQNVPNPFNAFTEMAYSLPGPGKIELSVFNSLGHRVSTFRAWQPTGKHRIVWPFPNCGSKTFPSGVYLYRLDYDGQSASMTKIRKMVLTK